MGQEAAAGSTWTDDQASEKQRKTSLLCMEGQNTSETNKQKEIPQGLVNISFKRDGEIFRVWIPFADFGVSTGSRGKLEVELIVEPWGSRQGGRMGTCLHHTCFGAALPRGWGQPIELVPQPHTWSWPGEHSTTTNHGAQLHHPHVSLPIWLSSQTDDDVLCWMPPWSHQPFWEGTVIGPGSWSGPRGSCRLSCLMLTLSRTSLQSETPCSRWEQLCDFLQTCSPDPSSLH